MPLYETGAAVADRPPPVFTAPRPPARRARPTSRVPVSVRLVGWLCALAPTFFALTPACRSRESTALEAKPAASAARMERGSRVIVERTAGNFIEATVLEEQGEHLRLQSADGSQSLRVSKTSVYSLSPPTTESMPGQFAICAVQRLVWKGCKVLSAQANQIAVVTAQSDQYRLGPGEVLRASELTRMNVEQTFAKAEERAHFLHELSSAGVPLAPAGWRPSARERVIAKRGNDWYAARVHEIEEDGVRVSWQDNATTEKVANDEIIPEPPYPTHLTRGQFALMRPRVESEPWVYVKVRAASDGYKVEDIKGEVSHAGHTALVPLTR